MSSGRPRYICAVVLCAVAGSLAGAEPPGIAPKPPLGWNSFDSYGVYLHEKAAMENLEAMAAHLRPYGYEYFVVDNGWFGEYRLNATAPGAPTTTVWTCPGRAPRNGTTA